MLDTIASLPLVHTRVVGVLEDDQHVADLTKTLLGVFGFIPYHVASAAEAIRLAEKNEVTNFILDVQIGETREGLDALEEIKNINPHSFVCVYSGYLDREVLRRRALRLNADFILPKTSREREDLYRIARAILDHERSLIGCEMALIDLELEQLRNGQPTALDWLTGKLDQPVKVDSQTSIATPSVGSDLGASDKNLAEYERLTGQLEWCSQHAGIYVGIVDGKLQVADSDLATVLQDLRRRFPEEPRFIKLVEREELILDVPTPLSIDETY